MGKWVRVDRRYNQPYRLTGYAHRVLFKWIGLFVLLVIVNASMPVSVLGNVLRLIFTLNFVGYAVWRIVAGRQPIRQQPAPTLAWQAQTPAIDPTAPVGQRNTRTIPQDVKIAVSARDGGRCRQCGSTADLHFDHVIPWSKGGANTITNIQILCGPCNRRKGADDIPAVF